MLHNIIEINACISVEDYTHIRKHYKIGKSGLLTESVFQLLRVTSIMTLVTTNRMEIVAHVLLLNSLGLLRTGKILSSRKFPFIRESLLNYANAWIKCVPSWMR